jgi:hypothetical protein
MRKFMPIAIAAVMAASPALAQQSGGGLVVVNISDVAQNIARDINVDVSNIPVTVQVPVSVAAAVCGLTVNALAVQGRGGDTRTCEATSNNAALNRIVQRSITRQK